MWDTLQLLTWVSSDPGGARRFYPAQFAQPHSPESSSGLSGLHLPAASHLGSRAPPGAWLEGGSLLRGLWAATQAEETPTCSTWPSAQRLQGSEVAQDPEGATPASSGLLLHTARGPRAARPLAPPPRPLVSPAEEILDGRERRRRFLFVGSLTQWLRCVSQFVNLPLARADSWGPTARSENGKPRVADSLSCSAGAPTWPLSPWEGSISLAETHREL